MSDSDKNIIRLEAKVERIIEWNNEILQEIQTINEFSRKIDDFEKNGEEIKKRVSLLEEKHNIHDKTILTYKITLFIFWFLFLIIFANY